MSVEANLNLEDDIFTEDLNLFIDRLGSLSLQINSLFFQITGEIQVELI